MSSSACTIDFLGLLGLFQGTDTCGVENTDATTELESPHVLVDDQHDSCNYISERQDHSGHGTPVIERQDHSGHGTPVIEESNTGPLVLVKEEFPKIKNNSGSTAGFRRKRYREKKTAVPSIMAMYPYFGSNDVAIQYFKSVGVIKNRVNEQCEILFERKKGRAGSNPTPRQCQGVLVARKFDNTDGEGDPVYS